MQRITDIIRSAILGHAVGDALGVPVEFCTREELLARPVTAMQGFGTYPFPPGTWSDDTSMTLAALDSLAGGLDYDAMMAAFCCWLNNSAYTPGGEVFDVGNSTKKSLLMHMIHRAPPLECGGKSDWDNGNGSLMRAIPTALYLHFAPGAPQTDNGRIVCVHNASALTHGHMRSKVGCGIYSFVIWALLRDRTKQAVYDGLAKAAAFYRDEPEAQTYARLLRQDIAALPAADIRGSGYVVDCLEAALWCLLTTDSYADCVLKAVNLGEDTDTTAAVAGGLAGLLYGVDAIPAQWLDTLLRRDFIEELCGKAAKAWGAV